MFYRWRRMEEKDRRRVWRLYGWFTALMACGSCSGAVAWAARMMQLVNGFKGNTSEDPAEEASLFALAYSWQAAFLVTYAVEFLCLSAAKLMVLDRMSVFAAPEDARLQKRWAAAGRVVMAAVVLGNAVGLAANAAAAVHYQKASTLAANNSGTEYLSRGATRRTHWISAKVLRGCRAAPHCRRVCCGWSLERAPREREVARSRRCFCCCCDGPGAAAADGGDHRVRFHHFCASLRIFDHVCSRV